MTNSIVLALVILICLLLLFYDRKPHQEIIKKWCRLFNLKVKYFNRYTERFEVDIFDNTMYISRFNKATHDNKEYLYSVAHEIGHLIDHAYKEYYYEESDVHSESLDKKTIYHGEVRAWEIASLLLKEEGLFDEIAFNNLKERCLDDYKEYLQIKKTKVVKSKTTKPKTAKVVRPKGVKAKVVKSKVADPNTDTESLTTTRKKK